MSYLRIFAAFWWGFVVGDDWRVAAGILIALGLTGALTDDGWSSWWLMPAAVAVLLARSLRRAVSTKADSAAGASRSFRKAEQYASRVTARNPDSGA